MSRTANTGSTRHALLGLLSIKPMSGYDLRQFIPESIGNFWSESYGQIYPALRVMADEGLAEKHTEQAPGRPDRHVYTLTDAGRTALRQWLEAPPRSQPLRDELLLKLFFGAQAPARVSVGHVKEFLAAQQCEVATYDAITAYLQRDHASNPQLPFWLITLSRGQHGALAGAAWARETLDVLERQNETDHEYAACPDGPEPETKRQPNTGDDHA